MNEVDADASVRESCSGAISADDPVRGTRTGASRADAAVRGPVAAAFLALRGELGLGLREASRFAGCDQRQWSRLEKGEDVRISTIEGLAGALGCTLSIQLVFAAPESLRARLVRWRREEEDRSYEERRERRLRRRRRNASLPAA